MTENARNKKEAMAVLKSLGFGDCKLRKMRGTENPVWEILSENPEYRRVTQIEKNWRHPTGWIVYRRGD